MLPNIILVTLACGGASPHFCDMLGLLGTVTRYSTYVISSITEYKDYEMTQILCRCTLKLEIFISDTYY